MKRTALAIVAIGVLLSACTGDTAGVRAPSETESVADFEVGESSLVTPSDAGDEAVGSGSGDTVLVGRKIIRQGSLILRDEDPEAIFQKIVVLVEEAGGFVASSELQRTDDEEPPRIDMTLRLPAGSFSATISAISNEVGEVLSRQLGSSDVTAQYVDIEARLRNLQTLESELLLLLTEVRDVADPEARDLLLVFDRLQSVRLEIEQLVGQQQAIDDQVDLATLRVTIVPEPAEIEITDDSWSPGDQIRESLASLVDVMENLANVAIWAGVFLVPVLAILAVPAGLLWWLVGRRTRRAAAATTPSLDTDGVATPADPDEVVDSDQA